MKRLARPLFCLVMVLVLSLSAAGTGLAAARVVFTRSTYYNNVYVDTYNPITVELYSDVLPAAYAYSIHDPNGNPYYGTRTYVSGSTGAQRVTSGQYKNWYKLTISDSGHTFNRFYTGLKAARGVKPGTTYKAYITFWVVNNYGEYYKPTNMNSTLTYVTLR